MMPVKSRLTVLFAVLALLFTTACKDDVSGNNSAQGDGTGTDDAGDLLDSDLDGTSDPDGTTDPNDGGGDPNDGGGTDDADPDEDPHEDFDPEEWACSGEYQLTCANDECVNYKVDPDNCGACGTVCDEGTACAGGNCVDSCLGSETMCDRQCVDTDTDSNHCSACGITCDDGEGCVNGTCVTSLSFETPTWCEGGGAAVEFDLDDDDRCAGSVAESTFRWAMCACDEAAFPGGGGIATDAFDSSIGPYIPGILGGSIGVNNDLSINGTMNIGGSTWVGGQSQVSFNGGPPKSILVDFHVDSHANMNAGTIVGNNARIGGNLGGSLEVENEFTLPDTSTGVENATYGSLVRAPVDFAPPCNCDEDALVPVQSLVADREFNNDNAAIGLESDAMSTGAIQRLDLPCGNYYLDGVSGGGDVVIVAHGRTALFIDGDVDPGRITMLATPEAELDVFVNGSINAGGLTFGSPYYPAVTRLYIGGENDTALQITDDVNIGGFVYAYPGRIQITDDVEIYGGLFANKIRITQPVSIHYDRQVQRSGDICEIPDEDPDDPNDPDAGFPDAGEPDAGEEPDPDPVCASLDDQCGESGDCCTPLICDQGTCSTAPCKVVAESCVYNTDCCSGICGNGTCVTG